MSAALRIERLAAGYGPVPVVRDATFAVAPGRCVALVGPNGAGKTTLFRAIAGELRPLRGRVLLGEGLDLTRLGMAERARAGVGYAPQQPAVLHDLSVRDNLRAAAASPAARASVAWAGPAGEGLVDEALEAARLAPQARTRASALSGGQLKRLGLARLLALRSRAWLCDEPFAGLDHESAAALVEVLDAARAQGVALLLAEHRTELLRLLPHEVVRVEDGLVSADFVDPEGASSEALRPLTR